MTQEIQATKQPLFTLMDEEQACKFCTFEESQIYELNVNLPLSFSVLEALNHFQDGTGSIKRVESMLEMLVKTEEYFYQDTPITFDKNYPILSLLPDDGQTYTINWKAFIIQLHISFLKEVGWDKIQLLRKNSTFKQDDFPVRRHSPGIRNTSAGSSIGFGSVARRQSVGFVGSFHDSRRDRPQPPTMVGNLQLASIPTLIRSDSTVSIDDPVPKDFDFSIIITIPMQCDINNQLFRGLVAAISTRGLLDYSLGQLILDVCISDLANAGLRVQVPPSSASAFDKFFSLVSTMNQLDEASLLQKVSKDQIPEVLDLISTIDPAYTTPHAKAFLESVLAPLCYHENPSNALRAATLYSNLIAGHSWDVHTVGVTTVNTPFTLEDISDNFILISAPSKSGNQFVVVRKVKFVPYAAGFFDFAYGRRSNTGEFEIDHSLPRGRYIVHPTVSREEIIHELPAFDGNGAIDFIKLGEKLPQLAAAGVTAVHVPGAIATNALYALTQVTDHSVLSKEAGGVRGFSEFAAKAKTLGLRVLLDFEPLVCSRNSSRKYAPFQTVRADDDGCLVTALIPGTPLLLMNLRNVNYWSLLAQEMKKLAAIDGVSGFFLGNIKHWDVVVPRDMKELSKVDPDDAPHYSAEAVLCGTVVEGSNAPPAPPQPAMSRPTAPSPAPGMAPQRPGINRPNLQAQRPMNIGGMNIGGMNRHNSAFIHGRPTAPSPTMPQCPVAQTATVELQSAKKEVPNCGLIDRKAKYSPFLQKLVSTIWRESPDAFLWIECDGDEENFVIESGLIPQNDAFSRLVQNEINKAAHCDNPEYIQASKAFREFFAERKKRLPDGAIIVTTFGSFTTGPAQVPVERLQLAVDFLYFLPDVPIVSSCLDALYCVKDAYSMDVAKPTAMRYFSPAAKFSSCLKNRASIRATCDWLLGGGIELIPTTYDGKELNAINAAARICHDNDRCAIVISSFFSSNMIFEIGINKLPIFRDVSEECVVEVVPILMFSDAGSTNSDQPQYYAYNEVVAEGSSLFMDIFPFATNAYEIKIRRPPIEGPIRRTLMEHVFLRLDLALQHNSQSILANNNIFNRLMRLFEPGDHTGELEAIIDNMPATVSGNEHAVFREALFYATRHVYEGRHLVELAESDDAMIAEREKTALNVLRIATLSTDRVVKEFGKGAIASNDVGPVVLVTPEFGPFSSASEVSPVVWNLSRELAAVGQDVTVITPLYRAGGHLALPELIQSYKIEKTATIDVYGPDKNEIEVHEAIIDGVRVWLLEHDRFFAAPYVSGSAEFRLQQLVVFAKAALELMCLRRLAPSLILTNDAPTGLIPAYARHTFGAFFANTRFVHMVHNLGAACTGKIHPPDQNTAALHNVHNLPDELLVDNFDHSFDPSLAALLSSDQWATVSKRYREELLESSPYNYFLRGFAHPFACSIGIDKAAREAEVAALGMTHEEAKAALQRKYFGKADEHRCLLVFCDRIVEQKGAHLIADSFEELFRKSNGAIQVLVAGRAEQDRNYGAPVASKMWDLRNRCPSAFWADPDEDFADPVLAVHAADYVLIPSQFEPSGIVQERAFVSGTPCVAFRTGGLADTVFEFDRERGSGNGVIFWMHRHSDFAAAVTRAVNLFYEKESYVKMRENAAKSVLTTEVAAVSWSREIASEFNKIWEQRPPVR